MLEMQLAWPQDKYPGQAIQILSALSRTSCLQREVIEMSMYKTTVKELRIALAMMHEDDEVEIFRSDVSGEGPAEEYDIFNIYRGGDDASCICSIELRSIKDRP